MFAVEHWKLYVMHLIVTSPLFRPFETCVVVVVRCWNSSLLDRLKKWRRNWHRPTSQCLCCRLKIETIEMNKEAMTVRAYIQCTLMRIFCPKITKRQATKIIFQKSKCKSLEIASLLNCNQFDKIEFLVENGDQHKIPFVAEPILHEIIEIVTCIWFNSKCDWCISTFAKTKEIKFGRMKIDVNGVCDTSDGWFVYLRKMQRSNDSVSKTRTFLDVMEFVRWSTSLCRKVQKTPFDWFRHLWNVQVNNDEFFFVWLQI